MITETIFRGYKTDGVWTRGNAKQLQADVLLSRFLVLLRRREIQTSVDDEIVPAAVKHRTKRKMISKLNRSVLLIIKRPDGKRRGHPRLEHVNGN